VLSRAWNIFLASLVRFSALFLPTPGRSLRKACTTHKATMLLQKLLQAALISCTAIQDVSARALAGKPNDFIKPYKRGEPLQDIVTWDEHSLLIRGERVMLYSGEFHPFRNPVPSLHLGK
jgi:hypothetical protein